MPPQKGEIWRHFLEVKNAKGTVTIKVSCKYCGGEYTQPNKCNKNVPAYFGKLCEVPFKSQSDIGSQIRYGPKTKQGTASHDGNDPDEPQRVPIDGNQNPSAAKLSCPGTSDTRNPQQNSAKRQKVMFESYFDRISKEEKALLDEHLAKAIYSKGLPLSTFEGPYMREAFEKLRPAYQPPSRYQLSNRLLKVEYNKAMSQNNDLIDKALCLTLVTDGWCNRRGDGIVNFLVGTPEPVFIKSAEPGIEKEDAKFISKELTKVMEKVGAYRVFLITADNAKVMKAACKLIQISYPHVYFIGCGSHSLNLLFKGILKISVFKLLLSQCSTLIKIRKKRQLYAYFKKKQEGLYGNEKASLVVPSPTRFSGAYLTFFSVKKNKQALQETVLVEKEGLVIPDDIRNIVLDNAFWCNLFYAVDYFQPLAQGTHLIESDDAKLSETVAISMHVKENLLKFPDKCPIPLTEREKVSEAVNHRIKNFCVTKLHLAAYLVDPLFCGRGLSDEECLAGISIVSKIATFLNLETDDVIENLADFKTCSSDFDNEIMWRGAKEMSDPVKWWNFYCQNQPLRPVATRILSLVPHSCGSERIWSSYEHVHSKKRNRLLNKRVEKLVVVKSNLCLKAKKEKCRSVEPKVNSSFNRRKEMSKYKAISLFESDINSDSESEIDSEDEWLWTSDEDLANSSDDENRDGCDTGTESERKE